MKIVIDATDKIVGRFASYVAKQALLGKEVVVVNCEKAILSGAKKVVVKKWQERVDMGQPQQGPFVQRSPDKFIRRTIRGMLPYKQQKGKEAFVRVMCHIGVPENMKESQYTEITGADRNKLPNLKFVTVGELCKELGGYHA